MRRLLINLLCFSFGPSAWACGHLSLNAQNISESWGRTVELHPEDLLC